MIITLDIPEAIATKWLAWQKYGSVTAITDKFPTPEGFMSSVITGYITRMANVAVSVTPTPVLKATLTQQRVSCQMFGKLYTQLCATGKPKVDNFIKTMTEEQIKNYQDAEWKCNVDWLIEKLKGGCK